MQLTIDKLLNYELLKGANVLTGQNQTTKRHVQWISVIEMPVENFVRQNEVVLTTAMGCNENVENFKKFVQDVIDSDASALLVALGRHVFSIPAEVVQLAEEQGFILIEIPWEVRFSNIIEEVMREINSMEQKERILSEQVQQEMLKLILKESELIRIVTYIQEKLDCEIVITDSAGALMEKDGYSSAFKELWWQYLARGILPVRKELKENNHNPMIQKIQTIEEGGRVMLQLPVLQVLADPQGYLYVLLPAGVSANSFLTTFRVNLLEHAATTISLWLSKKNAIEETKINLRSDFVQELAKGSFVSAEQASSRANLLGYDLSLHYVGIVGIPENLEGLFNKRKNDYDSFSQWFETMIRYIEEEIFYAAQTLKRKVMVTYQGDQLLVFLESPSGTGFDHATHFLDLVERRLRNLLPEVIMSWGVGSHGKGYLELARSSQHADLALSIGRRKKGVGQRMLYENTKVDRILMELAGNAEMKEIILSSIGPLVRYDQERNMDLIATFSTYNMYQGNVSQTARAMNLHRQSLLYRLRKIESLTNLSMLDPDDLFLLELSIKTWKVGMADHLNE
ncbi:MAG TPA: PucR family transcriptional regulator ligand-binding domain-containing protein [Planococcus sp. (in: firmicutes)]|nr:PucR family transcriptional regulator ligand-binding domain-containing protein [Planococcus sp. (in: firmicutes)]